MFERDCARKVKLLIGQSILRIDLGKDPLLLCIVKMVLVFENLSNEFYFSFFNAHDIAFRSASCIDEDQSLRMSHDIVLVRQLDRLKGVASD